MKNKYVIISKTISLKYEESSKQKLYSKCITKIEIVRDSIEDFTLVQNLLIKKTYF